MKPKDEKAEMDAKTFGLLILITITALLIPATPIAFMLIAAGEAFAAYADRLHGHLIALVPLVVVAVIWLSIFMSLLGRARLPIIAAASFGLVISLTPVAVLAIWGAQLFRVGPPQYPPWLGFLPLTVVTISWAIVWAQWKWRKTRRK